MAQHTGRCGTHIALVLEIYESANSRTSAGRDVCVIGQLCPSFILCVLVQPGLEAGLNGADRRTGT